ncbi:MAG: dethiobiotin synthase [Colwellia sp.]
MKKIFITATDTDAGKTFIASAITHALSESSFKVATFKPIAAGCEKCPETNDLINEDALLLTHFANSGQSINSVNPIRFLDPIAPHIAAAKENISLSIPLINSHFDSLTTYKPDVIITEGAGGWRLPLVLNETEQVYLPQFVQAHKMDVILIVNMKLGCLNHAMLTLEAIQKDGLNCIGWIANSADEIPMNNYEENLSSLHLMMPVPNLGVIDHYPSQGDNVQMSLHQNVELASKELNLQAIL